MFVNSHLVLSILGFIAVQACVVPGFSMNVIDVGDRRQMFFDHKFVESPDGVELTMNPPRKAGVAISRDQAWESGALTGGAILQHDGVVRFYYNATEFASPGRWGEARSAYATSLDGIQWEKPVLGQVEYKGSTDNNLIAEGGVPYIDPRDAEFPFRSIVLRGPIGQLAQAGIYIIRSRDGVHWTGGDVRVLPLWPDGTNQVIYDPGRNAFLAYVRQWIPTHGTPIDETSLGSSVRSVGYSEVADPDRPWPYDQTKPTAPIWGEDSLQAPGDGFTVAIGPDATDPPNTDIYHGAITLYDAEGEYWVAFPSVYRRPEGELHRGNIECQLAVSRNGTDWHRFREPYIRLGLPGEGDSQNVYMCPGIVHNGDKVFQYYHGTTVPRDGLPQAPGWGELYRLEQRQDGFVSIDAGETLGTFVTPPIVFNGDTLQINIDASAWGQAKFEICDADGKPYPGFDLDSCVPVTGNSVKTTVRWAGNLSLKDLQGKVVRLRVQMRGAKLYSFQFVNG